MRAIVLAEGFLGIQGGKTANGLVLHAAADDVVAVIDERHAGQDAGDVVAGRPRGIPVVASLDEALSFSPERLYIGFANIGGYLPEGAAETIQAALRAGLEVVNGLHLFLSEIPAYASAAEAGNTRIWDVRRPPDPSTMRPATGAIFDCPVPRVLVMGMDCDIGKRITAIELRRALIARDLDVGFVATGQTGCMLGPDAGMVIDRVPGDFAAGCVERMVVEVARCAPGSAPSGSPRDLVLAYGQASVRHPAFGGVALAILQGARPDAIVLEVAPGRRMRALYDHPGYAMPDTLDAVRDEIDLIERLGATKVVGLAVNPSQLSDTEDVEVRKEALRAAFGMPVVDPLSDDVAPLVDAVLAAIDGKLRRAAQ